MTSFTREWANRHDEECEIAEYIRRYPEGPREKVACHCYRRWLEGRLGETRDEIVKRWRYKSAAGSPHCDDCCHAWPDENGVPLRCDQEPIHLCREGHECNIRPVLLALLPPKGAGDE